MQMERENDFSESQETALLLFIYLFIYFFAWVYTEPGRYQFILYAEASFHSKECPHALLGVGNFIFLNGKVTREGNL